MHMLVYIFFNLVFYFFLYLILCILKARYKVVKTNYISFKGLIPIFFAIIVPLLWFVFIFIALLYTLYVLFVQKKEKNEIVRALLFALIPLILSGILFFIYAAELFQYNVDYILICLLGLVNFITPFVYFALTNGKVNDDELLLWLNLSTLLPLLIIIAGILIGINT